MDKFILYMEIDGLGVDEHGNPCPASIKADFNTDIEKMPPVAELNAHADLKEWVLRKSFLDMSFTAADCRFISDEEYESEYGSDDDESEEDE